MGIDGSRRIEASQVPEVRVATWAYWEFVNLHFPSTAGLNQVKVSPVPFFFWIILL